MALNLKCDGFEKNGIFGGLVTIFGKLVIPERRNKFQGI